jgi:pimeloyl-ACP methyl ester carboxylesterase
MAQVALARVIARADTYGMSDRLKLPRNMPPLLLLWGEQNPVLTCEAGKALRDRLQPQAFVPLPHCKHMAMLEDPEAFNQAMESFLTK